MEYLLKQVLRENLVGLGARMNRDDKVHFLDLVVYTLSLEFYMKFVYRPVSVV